MVFDFVRVCIGLNMYGPKYSTETHRGFLHCAKSLSSRSFSGPHFPVFGLNTEICFVNLHIQSECEKVGTRKTRNADTLYVILNLELALQEDLNFSRPDPR